MLGFLLIGTALSQSSGLVAGSLSQDGEGRVMYGNGYVCDDSFSTNEASVVCKTLNYPDGYEDYETGVSTSGVSPLVYTVDNLHCPASDTELSACSYNPIDDCFANEAVKVCCAGQVHDWECDGIGEVSAGGVIVGLLCCCCCYCVIPGIIIFMCVKGQQAHNQNRANINANATNTSNNIYTQPPPQTQMSTQPAPVYSQTPVGQQPYVATQNYAAPPAANNYAAPPQNTYAQPPPGNNYAAPPTYNADAAPPSYGGPPAY